MKNFILEHPVISKFFVCIITIIFGIFICTTPALACTGVYVGSEASVEGTAIIARSDDTSPYDKALFAKVYGGQDGEQIKHLKAKNGFEWDFPEKIYRTVCFPTVAVADGACYYSIGMNDLGVYINSTVTGETNKTAQNFNPYVENGLLEDVFPLVVCAQSATAREGVELVAKIIDEKGSAEDNIIMIADQNEVWYMEIYGGHQYCALKAPDDCVTGTGNDFLIETVDESHPDVICSKDLFSLPAEKGFAVYDSNGKMNIFNTYAGAEVDMDVCRQRTWRVQNILSPSTSTPYNVHTKIPLFYKPDKKVSVNDVMDIYRDRFDGTEFSLDVNGNNTYRSINTETSQSILLTQIFKDLPANMSLLTWMTWSNSEFNTWIPFSNLESVFDSAYTYENKNYYNLEEDNAFSAFKKLNSLAEQKRSIFKTPIMDYWHFYEKYITKIADEVLHDAANSSTAQGSINDFCTTWQAQNYYDAKRLCDEIEWYFMNTENSYSVKTVDGIHTIKPPAPFLPYVDIVLAAKMLGWKIDEDKYQEHNSNEYDKANWGSEEQADNGGMEGYVKISNGDNSAEIHTGNGHRLSSAKVTINDQDFETKTKVYDGKTYVQYNFVNEILNLTDTNNYTKINSGDISPNRSYDKIGPFNLPTWIQVLAIIGFAIIGDALIYVVMKKSKKDKK